MKSLAVTEHPWSKSIRWGDWRLVHYQPEMFGDEDWGTVNVKCRWGTGARTVSASSAPKSCTYFWWHDGQNHRPLHENASKY